jgi:hypothetical protein
MATFPGNVLIIDDKFDIIYGAKPIGRDRVEYANFNKIKAYCDDNGLPLLSISGDINFDIVEKKINLMNNVRLLILDLDFDGDGNVTQSDEELVLGILRIAIKRFGYFFLLINSSTPESWEEIKRNIPAEDKEVLLLIGNLQAHINKEENISSKLDSIIRRNHSVSLIYLFEAALNEARDKSLKEFIDYDRDTWKSWIEILKRESKGLVHHDISNVFLGLIRQHLAGVQFDISTGSSHTLDPQIIQRIFKNVNYLRNRDRVLNKQPIWTGNIYKTTYSQSDKKYALVITPECDIAQNKYLNHKIIFGIEITAANLPDYSVDDDAPPTVVIKFGKKSSSGKWYPKSEIKRKIRERAFISHLFLLPFASEGENSVLFDYRHTASLSPNSLKRWKLVLRVNDPLIIEIMDNYSNLYNRKGLISYPNMDFLPSDI